MKLNKFIAFDNRYHISLTNLYELNTLNTETTCYTKFSQTYPKNTPKPLPTFQERKNIKYFSFYIQTPTSLHPNNIVHLTHWKSQHREMFTSNNKNYTELPVPRIHYQFVSFYQTRRKLVNISIEVNYALLFLIHNLFISFIK